MGDIIKLRKKLHAGQSLSRKECWDLLDRVSALPAASAEDVRAGALKEAVAAANKAREAVIHSGNRAYIDGISVGHDRAERAILALIPEAKP